MNEATRRGTDLLTSGLTVMGHALLRTALFVGLFLIVPRYDKLFRDYGMNLPWLTENVITVSRWVVNGCFLLVMSVPFLIALDFGILFHLRSRGRQLLSWLWSFLLLFIPGIVVVLCAVAIWLPYQKLHEGLSK
jgi:type II secretory pathway component PulF